jgi:type IX secretion system substrate protein
MKHVTFFISIFICLQLSAQPTLVNQKTVGGSSNDELSSIDITTDKGFIIGGTSSSPVSFEKTDSSRGYSDYWIVKFNNSGSIQFDKTFGSDSYDELHALQQTSDGGFIIGGESWGGKTGDKSDTNRHDVFAFQDYWIVKLDAAGNKQWDKTLGGYQIDELNALQQTKDGGYILGGSSSSVISGEKTDGCRGVAADYWIIKLDNSGNIQWDKTIGGTGYDNLTVVKQTADGGYILGGTSTSSVSYEKTDYCRGSDDYWIVKLDKFGNIQWDKTIGGNAGDLLRSIDFTADGGYILGGYSGSNISGEKTENSRGMGDYWVVKVDASGNIQWQKTIGGSNDERLFSIHQTKDGGYILGGYSNSNISGEKTENSKGDYDYWIVKTDNTGNIQWQKTIGGSSEDDLMAVEEVGKDNYLLAGSSESGKTGDKTQYRRGDYFDYWVVGLKNISEGTDHKSITSPKQNNIFITYPNPAKNILYIQNAGKARFILSNPSGKVYKTITIENNGSIDLNNVPAGIYFITNTATGKKQSVIINK